MTRGPVQGGACDVIIEVEMTRGPVRGGGTYILGNEKPVL